MATRGNPTELSWFEMASLISGSFYTAAFMRGRRVKCELYVDSGDAKTNSQLIAGLVAARPRIEAAFGGALEWNPPDDQHRRGSVVAVGDGDVTEVERHDEFIEWFVRTSARLRAAIEDVADTIPLRRRPPH